LYTCTRYSLVAPDSSSPNRDTCKRRSSSNSSSSSRNNNSSSAAAATTAAAAAAAAAAADLRTARDSALPSKQIEDFRKVFNLLLWHSMAILVFRIRSKSPLVSEIQHRCSCIWNYYGAVSRYQRTFATNAKKGCGCYPIQTKKSSISYKKSSICLLGSAAPSSTVQRTSFSDSPWCHHLASVIVEAFRATVAASHHIK
jgi:hypothetical protein